MRIQVRIRRPKAETKGPRRLAPSVRGTPRGLDETDLSRFPSARSWFCSQRVLKDSRSSESSDVRRPFDSRER